MTTVWCVFRNPSCKQYAFFLPIWKHPLENLMAQSFINADDQKVLGMDFLGGPVVKDSELQMGEFHGEWVPPLVWSKIPCATWWGHQRKPLGNTWSPFIGTASCLCWNNPALVGIQPQNTRVCPLALNVSEFGLRYINTFWNFLRGFFFQPEVRHLAITCLRRPILEGLSKRKTRC